MSNLSKIIIWRIFVLVHLYLFIYGQFLKKKIMIFFPSWVAFVNEINTWAIPLIVFALPLMIMESKWIKRSNEEKMAKLETTRKIIVNAYLSLIFSVGLAIAFNIVYQRHAANLTGLLISCIILLIVAFVYSRNQSKDTETDVLSFLSITVIHFIFVILPISWERIIKIT